MFPSIFHYKLFNFTASESQSHEAFKAEVFHTWLLPSESVLFKNRIIFIKMS